MPSRSSDRPSLAKEPIKAFRTLRTFTLITTAVLVLNKAPSIYALASVFTKGSALESPLQMSMHVYSFVALVLAVCLLPVLRHSKTGQTRETRPMALVLLAHLHILDFILGIFFTVVFASTWFKMIAHPDPSAAGPGAADMDAAAGFTNPEHPVEAVEIDTQPSGGIVSPNTDHVVVGEGKGSAAAAGNSTPAGSASAFGPEGIATMIVMCGLWAIRSYLLACVVLYARGVARHTSMRGTDIYERHGLLDVPGRWLAQAEGRFWTADTHRLVKRKVEDTVTSSRQSIESNKEWR